MRYGVAALIAMFMLFAGIALAGAGHGWVSGGVGCFALAPIAWLAWVNALGRNPSFRVATATLALGLVVCVVVAISTMSEGFEYFFGYWRAAGVGGILVGGLAYLNWALMSAMGIFRAQRVQRLGT